MQMHSDLFLLNVSLSRYQSHITDSNGKSTEEDWDWAGVEMPFESLQRVAGEKGV